ncbi:MAG TPA: DUF87 domain-containing protein, partial [Thermomicrobiaceae bacterium]|nr:DUF87 domain-containing protein [Thermomicrobiaceae bacterium]
MSDDHQPRHLNGHQPAQQRLGVVTEGSFNGGLTVRLNGRHDTEGLRVGSFVVLEGRDNLYFSLITDMRLRVTDQALASHPPPIDSPFVSRALAGTHTFATVEVRPNLMLEEKDNLTATSRPAPARNIPMHFAALRSATEADFDLVFGEVSLTRFALGTPPTMDIPIPIDLEELVTRSNGIFGQSGSGKSVLTRLLLFGLIKSRLAAPLVFDMHSEYARQSRDDPSILGLVDLFGSQQVRVFSLDETDTRARSVLINPEQIQPGDIELLRDELNLRETFAAVSHQLWQSFRHKWLARLMAMSPDDLADYCKETGVHQGAAEALKQKLALIADKPYIKAQASVD